MAMSKGCTIALIIVVVLVVIIAGIGIFIWLNFDKFVMGAIDQAHEMILENIPEEYSEADVNAIFTEFKRKYEADELDKEKTARLAQEFQLVVSDEKIDVAEARSLLDQMREIIGYEMQEPSPMEEEVPDSLMAEPAGA